MGDVTYPYRALADRKGDPSASKGHAGFSEWKPTEGTVAFVIEAPGLKAGWETARLALKLGQVRAQHLHSGEQLEISGRRYTVKQVKRFYGETANIPWARTPDAIPPEALPLSNVQSKKMTDPFGQKPAATATMQTPDALAPGETIREIMGDARRRIALAADVPVQCVEFSLRIIDKHLGEEPKE